MPYRSAIEKHGLSYVSHDFEKYDGSRNFSGLQSEGWRNSGHDLVCDITDLPANSYDYLICTEVLEHVPDPVSALKVLSQAVRPKGKLLITVPFASRMHQAPFWFSSGLSPFWFNHHAINSGLEINELTVAGDFVDMMIQDLPLLLQPLNPKLRVGNGVERLLKIGASWLRNHLPNELVESGGQSVFFIATRP
jgi:SAM-dependent methyltransferase